ncbi:hypothetical protein MINS_11340 [Mycolicibacterium insubricum]|jgi:hypothetical protein|uniref:Uncharacterized protein n=1 Tax=Mycolicibacterium insubricum TaxID=444597 RepID=A0A1X0DBR7_9MYCO|nr:hypothetical protein [Mycolicibacterium insubricum]ORA69649.1 hypothetical protein BST26_13040 [Mycolicibacterium insubricum]BBZ65705.1 hypothetical protein MINS_11340 [Mycolicibacterium insubricum]
MRRILAIGAVLAATVLTGAPIAAADQENPDPFNPADCMANANAICNLGPYGPNSLTNPANINSPLNPNSPSNPNNPNNPASINNPNNPANPNSMMNPANPLSPLNPMNQHH